MKKIHYTYKFRLYPNNSQKELLEKHFGCIRSVYNCGLELKRWLYNEYNISLNKNELFKQLTDTKKDNEFKYLKEINSQSIQQAIHNLYDAYDNFFNYGHGFPRFKSKKSKSSFKVPQHIHIENNKLIIPKFKAGIKLNIHRPIKGVIKNATISKLPSGKYYVSIMCEKEYKPSGKNTGSVVGLDMGIKELLIDNNGNKYENHKYLKQNIKKLKYKQRKLSKKKKGSREYENQRKRIANLHERIKNIREDRLHKISRNIINNNDIICVENLNVKGMIKNHKLSQAISDASWGKLMSLLQYKGEWNDKVVIKIDRYFASSKTCSHCEWKYDELSLNERKWECPCCGTLHDRDVNAATNILNEGLNKLSGSGTESDTKQKRVEPLSRDKVVKPEAHELFHG